MNAAAATMDPAEAAGYPTLDSPVRPRGLSVWELPVVLALAAMMLLPITEIALRACGHSGLAGAGVIVQHLTLIVGMAGGALAARNRRLLALSTLPSLLRGAWPQRARWFAGTFSAAITAASAIAAAEFVASERTSGKAVLVGLPLWIVQSALPLGFGVVTLLLIRQAAAGWRGRVAAAVVVSGAIACATWTPLAPHTLVGPVLVLLVAATLLGAPVFVTIGGAGLVLFWGAELPIASMSVEHYGLVTKPALPTIPLFTLAGYFMAEGGAAGRLVRVFQALFGWFSGGPAIATALVCAFFTSFTGGSGVTILALGGLLLPALRAARFSERNALGLLTGAGSLGILLPPCLPVVLYAIIAKVDIRQMFLGGLLPGILLIALTAAWGLWAGRRAHAGGQKFNFAESYRAVWAAKWELALPLVALVALFSGWATPVEAAALTAAYAFFIEVVVHRDLGILRDCPRVMAEAGLMVGGILLILGVALGLTNYLIDAQVPDQLADWAFAHVHSRWVFLLGLNIVLLVVGGVVEIYAAIVVVVPLLVPVGARLGIDPIHLGIVFLANMELGFLVPPVGLNLLLASSRFGQPLGTITRAAFPMMLVLLAGVLAITYFAPLSTALPAFLSVRP